MLDRSSGSSVAPSGLLIAATKAIEDLVRSYELASIRGVDALGDLSPQFFAAHLPELVPLVEQAQRLPHYLQ